MRRYSAVSAFEPPDVHSSHSVAVAESVRHYRVPAEQLDGYRRPVGFTVPFEECIPWR